LSSVRRRETPGVVSLITAPGLHDGMTDTGWEGVLWDVGGVIVDLKSIRNGYAEFVGKLAGAHGLDPGTALEAWKGELGDYFAGTEGSEYRPAREGYVRATESLLADVEHPPESEEWWPHFREVAAANVRPEPGAIEVVEALDDAGLYQGVLSDVDTDEALSMFEAFGIRERFEHVTTSEEVGYRKPDPRMFETATERLREAGVDPARTLMVGDRYRHDVEGGREAGLVPVGYGEGAHGPAAEIEIRDLRELLDIVGVTAAEDGD
jgi:putative hydrolase of the HAD superfamily